MRVAITQVRAIEAREQHRRAPFGADLSRFLTDQEAHDLRHATMRGAGNCSVADLVAMAARGHTVQAPEPYAGPLRLVGDWAAPKYEWHVDELYGPWRARE